MPDIAYCSSCLRPIAGRVISYKRSNWCDACFLKETGGPLPPTDEELAEARRAQELATAAVRHATQERLATVQADVERRRKERSSIRQAIQDSAIGLLPEDVLLSTTPDVSGYRVVYSLDVIAEERVLGVSFLADFLSKVGDFLGGSDPFVSSTFARARAECLYGLRKQAAAMGATAVIGITLDYGELTAQGKTGVYIASSGTAVVVEPVIAVDRLAAAKDLNSRDLTRS